MSTIRSAAVAKPTATKSAAQILEEQKARYQALIERRTKVFVELEPAGRQLEEAEAEAEREFGTRDLAQLRKMYLEREQENERRVNEFLQSLETLEQELAEVERQLAS